MLRSLAALALLPFFVLVAPIHAEELSSQPPVIKSVAFTSPASGTVTVPVTATDDNGLGEAVAAIDGKQAATALFTTCGDDGACTAKLSIDTTKYPSGERDVDVHVTDTDGNRSFTYGMSITFDNPDVTPTPTPTPEATVTPEETATPSPTPTVQQPHDRPTPTPTPTPMPLGEIGILGDEATRYTTRDFLSIPKRPRASKVGALTMTARCPLPKTCSLRVSLTRAGKSYGSGRVTVGSKKSGKLTLKLTKAARAALKKKPQSLRLTVAGYPGVVITLR
ncbi:hypothetical protein OJ997_20720 [Solirubrobacter phytolaccae]|uniref:Uncharacterized protein n=1 Tax=Solirubrobacter phytolaccae TaxID=1404360 RepID=A0A9X3S9L3_9ACTN|nr:hypothetical protein [Solirubrobacter phytolaccae]MDA0182748.1 hypothetical protein [Solirubrobacter phytolaccae]